MKLTLVVYIGLLTLLGAMTQAGFATNTLKYAFISINMLFLPIISVSLAKGYFHFSTPTKLNPKGSGQPKISIDHKF
ncbi:MAG: hypothetical protein GW763_06325 [Paraglaciecola sp.]|nr:hypothetical protein [Paraglaciecola sp.]NCT47600.1 hypothetical protein [Paraglaciecola sp.]